MTPRWEDTAKALPYGSSRKVLHCGSSPAARAYNNPSGIGLHCFRCGETLFIPHGPRSAAEILAARRATEQLQAARQVPGRAIPLTDPDCPSEARIWPLKTGLTPEEASDTYGMRYDPATRRVLIPLDGGFLARALHGERPKYIKAGADSVETFALTDDRRDLLVVVEDILSAIKIWRSGFPSAALLGTAVSATQAALIGSYGACIVWTDADPAGDAAWSKLRKRLGLYPTRLYRVKTDLDPKEIHISAIKAHIKEKLTCSATN